MLYLLMHAAFLSAHASFKKHQHFYDITQFDIEGVKLGMSLQEAQAAVIKSLKVPESAVKLVSDVTLSEITEVTTPLYFSVVKDKAKLIVFFKPAIPVDKDQPLRVHTVSYQLRWHSQDAASMRSSVIKKYGYPTNGIKRGDKYSRLEWCWVPPEKEEQATT